MASDLSALLTQSRALTSHLIRPDLPTVNLSLEQVEAQSRRLVSRQPISSSVNNDNNRANYLLAQAHVDAAALGNSIAHLNTTSTFSPLQPLQDTDITGYLRHAHEQNLISVIEEGRRETQREFYLILEDRCRRDWDAKKRRVFEEFGGRMSRDTNSTLDLKKSFRAKGNITGNSTPTLSLQMQSKMMAYDRVIADLNSARLRGTSYPVIHALMKASLTVAGADPKSLQMVQNFHVLTKITMEPPALPPIEHAGAHILNAPVLERKYAKDYLGPVESRNAMKLRKQIANGAREALEDQYWDILERTVQARPIEAKLGGDPSVSNKVRAFLLVRYYRNGQWEDYIEMLQGQPIWAKLFFMIRTGHVQEALQEAIQYQSVIENREPSFVSHLKTWAESLDRRLPKPHRDHLQSLYNTHLLRFSTTDPFKIALYKVMGKLEVSKRSVQHVTTTTEDWLWLQLAMVDEDDDGGLRGLAEVLMGYGELYFDGVMGQQGHRRGVWAGVLLMCGQFERAVEALWEHQETEVEAIHLAIGLAYHGLLRISTRAETSDLSPLTIPPAGMPSIALAHMVWRYVRQFVKMDAKEALQYVYCVSLSANQSDNIGLEQLDSAWDLTRRIIVLADSGTAWEELVGGFRPDGTRFARSILKANSKADLDTQSGVIEQGAPLLNLATVQQYNAQILVHAARQMEENDRIAEAVKLYNLAGDYATVTSCLAHALGKALLQPMQDERNRALEQTAKDILTNYERTNRAVGKDRDAVIRLLRIREALNAKNAGRADAALEVVESMDLIPLEGDVAKITRRAEEFKDLHESLQKTLQIYLPLTMDALSTIHQSLKSSGIVDSSRQMTLNSLRKKSRSLMIFAGILKYRMSPDIYSYLARLDVEIAL